MTAPDHTGMTRERLEAAIAKTPFAVSLGAELSHYDTGAVEVSVEISDWLKQHHGFVHGGVVGFIADSACAWAAASIHSDVVTAEYKISFLRPAVGNKLVGRGTVISSSRGQSTCKAEVHAIKDGAQSLVAVALATVVRL